MKNGALCSKMLPAFLPSSFNFSPSFRVFSSFKAPPGQSDIDSSRLKINRLPRSSPPYEEKSLKFGEQFSDHILTVQHDLNKGGWQYPEIGPLKPFELHPASSVFHYGLEAFEGMKGYLDNDNKIRMFRPDKNMERLNQSAQRLSLPTFNPDEFLTCIKELLKIDKNQIPFSRGYSMYIRPTLIATEPRLSVGPSKQCLLYCILSPVGPYYPRGFKPVSLLAESHYQRAFPGGTGAVKSGGNYAATIYPQVLALKKGFDQVLWLSDHKYVTEVGTMNMFSIIEKDGKKHLITAPLDGTILPGVTRDSILHLAKATGEFEVEERQHSIDEIIQAQSDGTLLECFGAGTAAIVSPIKNLNFEGQDYAIPLDPTDPNAPAGKWTQYFFDTILGIQYGDIPSEWSIVVD